MKNNDSFVQNCLISHNHTIFHCNLCDKKYDNIHLQLQKTIRNSHEKRVKCGSFKDESILQVEDLKKHLCEDFPFHFQVLKPYCMYYKIKFFCTNYLPSHSSFGIHFISDRLNKIIMPSNLKILIIYNNFTRRNGTLSIVLYFLSPKVYMKVKFIQTSLVTIPNCLQW